MRELSLHILDVLENALAAGATSVDVDVDENPEADQLTIRVRDNGRGMDAATLERALDPFFTTRTTRHVGLGLPLFAAAAGRCGGTMIVESEPGHGTTVTACFRHNHVDRAPLGDMPGTLLAFLLHGADRLPRLRYRHRLNGETFELDTAAIEAELGEIPLSHPPVRAWLSDYIRQEEARLSLGGNDAKTQDH
jgi:anti-sigma regulatory factor (Ser/Thr protein kinase)